MVFNKCIAAFSLLFLSSPPSDAAVGEGEVCRDVACYKRAIKDGIEGCRKRINAIDKKDHLWRHKPKFTQFSKKKALSKLDKEMPYATYLDHINSLKLTTGKTQTKLNKLMRNAPNSPEGTQKLGRAITEELAIFKPNCSNAVNAIADHLAKRQAVIGK
ncbi:MAG: hypothetical protein HRU43_06925 [Simkaniaceae bacterium]|nr:hypothetical protein [Simkaniaceae bacterium]